MRKQGDTGFAGSLQEISNGWKTLRKVGGTAFPEGRRKSQNGWKTLRKLGGSGCHDLVSHGSRQGTAGNDGKRCAKWGVALFATSCHTEVDMEFQNGWETLRKQGVPEVRREIRKSTGNSRMGGIRCANWGVRRFRKSAENLKWVENAAQTGGSGYPPVCASFSTHSEIVEPNF